MKRIKLKNLLFENQSINYFQAPFALAVDSTKTNFILYNTKEYPDIVAYAKVKFDSTNCPSAVQISKSVREDKYPGAGEALYKIISSYLNMPITSDRTISTSPAAQKLWKKIENSNDFEHFKLDNWIWKDDFETKVYVKDIDKNRGSFKISDQPETETTEDDCVLPGVVSQKNLEDGIRNTISVLGTPNAHKTNVDYSQLIKNHERFMKNNNVNMQNLIKTGNSVFVSKMTMESLLFKNKY
jgi:hypothetical protein